ncbi:MAG: sulfatase [Myxococcota bacterium]
MFWLVACDSRPPDVVIVSIDTTRADRMSLYGGAAPTSPNLERIAARGVVFERAFAQGNESLYSHATMLTGRYASEVARPEYTTFGLPGDATTLAEALSAYGYATGAFTSGGHVVADYGFSQGFDTFQSVPPPRFGSFSDTVPAALAWLDSLPEDQPTFTFVHGYDAHAPYAKRGPFLHPFDVEGATPRLETLLQSPTAAELVHGRSYFPDRTVEDLRHAVGHPILGLDFYTKLVPREGERVETLTDREIEHLRSHYDAGVAYGDVWLGLLAAGLQARGRLDDTLLVVVSDHGEDLLEHGFANHRTTLADTVVHVPLVIVGPGFGRGERRGDLVELRDLVPTVLARVPGAMLPAGVAGRDLAGAPPVDAVFAEGVMDMVSVRTDRWKLVYRGAPLAVPDYADRLAAADLAGPQFQLYDLVADPGEHTPVRDPVAAGLRDRLVAWRRSLAVSDRTVGKVDPAVKAALREHGYWEPTPETGPPSGSRSPPPP